MTNALENLPKLLDEAKQKLLNVEHQLESAKSEVNKPFEKEQELSDKLERLSELNALLNMDEKGDSEPAIEDEEKLEKKDNDRVSIKEKLAEMKGVQSVSGLGLMIGIETEKPAKDIVNACIGKGRKSGR